LDGHDHAAGGPGVWILPPHIVHDGRPATADGFQKRVLYLEPAVVGETLIGASVDHPALTDPRLRPTVSRLHEALACIDDRLEAETRLAFVVEAVRASLGAPTNPTFVPPSLAEHLRDWLDARPFASVTIAQAAADLHASP